MLVPLHVPKTERTQHLLLDADSRKLTSEIHDLPYADIPSALSLAYRRLYTFNRFALPPAKRLKLVGPFHHAFTRFVDYYRNQLRGSLYSRELNLSELDNLLAFLQELSFSYKHIIQDTLEKNKQPSGLAIALFMAMNYQYVHGLFSYSRGKMLGTSHWKEIHYLYNLASNLGQTQKSLTLPDGQPVTIERLYKQALLTGLSDPHTFSAEDQWFAAEYVERFGNLLKLVQPTTISMARESYSVNRLCTQAAIIPNTITLITDDLRVLDFSTLLDTAHRQLQAISNGEQVRTLGIQGIQRPAAIELLKKLTDHWSRSVIRHNERQPSNEQLGLVWGLENICNMLDPEQRRLDQKQGRKAGSDKRAWAVAGDESITGFRVQLSGSPTLFPDAGQIIVLIRHHNNKKILEAGVVKWAAIHKDNSPNCGIERIRGAVKKIRIYAVDDDLGERNGLLILARTQNGTLKAKVIAPAGMLKSNSEVMVQPINHHERLEIQIHDKLHKTRNVDTFNVVIRET